MIIETIEDRFMGENTYLLGDEKNNKCVIMCIHSPELALEYSDVIFLMKNGKIISDIDVHTADITEINEKMSFLYSNINVVECADANGRLHKTVLSL